MDLEEFQNLLNELLQKHYLTVEWNCDLWSLVDAFIYRTSDNKHLCTVTGIRFNRNGDLVGDFSGHLKILNEQITEKLGV